MVVEKVNGTVSQRVVCSVAYLAMQMVDNSGKQLVAEMVAMMESLMVLMKVELSAYSSVGTMVQQQVDMMVENLVAKLADDSVVAWVAWLAKL